jgi:hypothetical protein
MFRFILSNIRAETCSLWRNWSTYLKNITRVVFDSINYFSCLVTFLLPTLFLFSILVERYVNSSKFWDTLDKHSARTPWRWLHKLAETRIMYKECNNCRKCRLFSTPCKEEIITHWRHFLETLRWQQLTFSDRTTEI